MARDQTRLRSTSPSGCAPRRTRHERRSRLAGGGVAREAVAEVERPVAPGSAVGGVEEALVRAVERVAGSLIGALDAERTHRQRLAHRLHAAEALATALRLRKEVDVDLDREHFLEAAHVAPARSLVFVGVEERAVHLEAARRVHDLVAESAALPAFGRLVHLRPDSHSPKCTPMSRALSTELDARWMSLRPSA